MPPVPPDPPAPTNPPPPAPPTNPPPPPPPADPPPAPPPPAAGFPADTPVAEMTVAQQAAYWQHQSKKHEGRAIEYRTAAGGKSAAEVRAEMEVADAARREKLTADERAVEDARRETREATTREYGPKSVRAAFDLLLGDMPKEERDAEIELLDLSKFLNTTGDVDTDKVRRTAQKIAPAGKGTGDGHFDFGGGRRQERATKGGVAQVMEERRRAREAQQ